MRASEIAVIAELLEDVGGLEKVGAEFVALIALQGACTFDGTPEAIVRVALEIGDAFVAAVKARRGWREG